MMQTNYDAWFLLLAFLQIISIGLLIIIIGILVYNIIKRTERFTQPQNNQKEKDGVGFGRY